MSEYILRHIYAGYVKKYEKKEDSYLVFVALPAAIKNQYGVDRGCIFVYKKNILDTDDSKYKDLVLMYDEYDVSIKLHDRYESVRIMVKDLCQANEDFVNSFVTLHVSKQDIKESKYDGLIMVRVPIPERLIRECNYSSFGYLHLYSFSVEDTDDDDFKDVVLKRELTYGLHVPTGDSFVKFDVSCDEIYKEYEMLEGDDTEELVVKRVSVKKIKIFDNNPVWGLIWANAPQRIQSDYCVPANLACSIRVGLDCIRDTDDDAYKDIVLRKKMYLLSCKMYEEHASHYRITKQEAYDVLSR